MVRHWLETRHLDRPAIDEHINQVRISAETIVKLNLFRQRLMGNNRTIYEQHLIDTENNVVVL